MSYQRHDGRALQRRFGRPQRRAGPLCRGSMLPRPFAIRYGRMGLAIAGASVKAQSVPAEALEPIVSTRVGPLLLVGGNKFTPGNEPHDSAFVRWCGERPAYIVVTAAVRHQPDLARRHAVDWFASLGLAMDELPMRTRTQAVSRATSTTARDMGGAYLCGGDPGIVVTTLRETAGWAAAVAAWRAGAALAGSSAGAMALGEWTLLKGRMPGDHERRYADALRLVPGLAVIPHWDEFGATWAPSVERGRPRRDVVLLGLDVCTAAAWDGAAWHAMGRGRVTVIAPDGARAAFCDGAEIEGLPPPR